MKTNNTLLSWVYGNDVLLLVWLYERSLNGNHEQILPFELSTVESFEVTIHNSRTSVAVEASRLDGESNCLVLQIPGDTERGRYSVKVAATVDERNICSFESPVFSIVSTNEEANTILQRVNGSRQAEFTMDFQLVGGAVTAGKNAYELWLEAGNVGTLDDFLNHYIADCATHDENGLMSSEDKTDWDTVKEMDVLSTDGAHSLFNEIFT